MTIEGQKRLEHFMSLEERRKIYGTILPEHIQVWDDPRKGLLKFLSHAPLRKCRIGDTELGATVGPWGYLIREYDVPKLHVNARRPFDDDQPDGYLESDKDYVRNNFEVAVALLDRELKRGA
jgi:hypothetical protein